MVKAKPIHEQVEFSNVLPDRFERAERRVYDEPYWDDDEDRGSWNDFGVGQFGFDE